MADYSRPVADVTAGWSNSTGADGYALLDESAADDADYVFASSSGLTQEVRMRPMSTPDAAANVVVRYRVSTVGAGGKVQVSLYCGAALVKSDTTRDAAATYEMSVTPAEYAAVADWTDMRVRCVSVE